MKWTTILCLAPAVSAIINPDQQVFQKLSVESRHKSFLDQIKAGLGEYVEGVKDKVSDSKDKTVIAFNEALQFYSTAGHSLLEDTFDARAWLENNVDELYDAVEDGSLTEADASFELYEEKPPHHPHHPPKHGKPKDPHHKNPHFSNLTIYQLIAESKYTTKLAALLDDYPDLIQTLNSTKANHTIFVPIDAAFEKIPEKAPKPSKEQLEKILTYHVAPGLYPAGRVLSTHTIPTLLETDELADDTVPQRLSVNIGLRGLTINFYSRIVGINFFAKNGVIHAVDSIIIPPPPVLKIIDLLPSEFSTLELGLVKTGLLDELSEPHKGGTFFAPSNFAFAKLGPRINAFLFSKYGEKYLKALLKYHIVPGTTLYSDAVYTSSDDEETKGPKKGYKHYDLPTLLEDKSLNVDVVRYGGFISIKINGFVRVVTQDGVAKDGVVQVVGDVLIPPKTKSKSAWPSVFSDDAEMSLDEFKARLEPLL